MTITVAEIKLLLLVASPLTAWRSEDDPTAELLLSAGLMAESLPGISRITPLGLRVLAHIIEQGLHKRVIERMISEVNHRQGIIATLASPDHPSNPVAP